MPEDEQFDALEIATLVKRLDRQRRAREAAESISEQATGVLYDKQQHLKLLQAVAVAANESPSLDDALEATVDQMCTDLGWPVGHVYLAIGTTSILTLSDIWFIGDLKRFENFKRAVETTLIAPTGGVAGRALAERAPVATADLEHVLPGPLATAAREAGLKSALAFPVIGIDAPVAVLEFFSTDAIVPDEMLVEIVTRIGNLLGKAHVRTRANATLRSSVEQYRLLFEGNPNPMWISDAETQQLIAVNDAAISQYGFARGELLSMKVPELRPESERRNSTPRSGLIHLQRKDGRVITVEISGYDVPLPGRRARMTMAVDVDEGRRASEALRESERRFREMLDTIELAAVLLDVVGIVTYCNPHLLAMAGYTKDDVIGRNFFDLFLPEDERKEAARGFDATIGRGVIAAHLEMDIMTRLGERRTILWNNTVLRNPQGSILGTASIGSDVTEQRLAEKQLRHNAFHDALTGLPNRALFLDRVGQAVGRAKRDERRTFAVLLLDVDHFKNVNDSLGHVAGDQLLVTIGERLLRCVRTVDTVARFGGDEFTVLIEKINGPNDARRAAERIQREIGKTFRIDDTDIFASVSIGIIIGGHDYDGPEHIVRDADTAMYRAKAQGRARSEIFDSNMRADVVARLQVETDLRRAIERRELRVFYQPIVRLSSAEMVGHEALVRWQHPTRGLVSPADFIPIAEETGLIVPLGQFVLREACKQAAKWKGYMSVNVSNRQFAQSDLVADVRTAIEESGISPDRLYLEITESVIMQHADAALQVMIGLRAMGCRISLDDFGTGFSSLSWLHRFPIDTLKIDSSFVRAARERKNVEIIRSILALGHGLSLDIIAEGIETTEQRELLQSLDCDFGQGYLFAKPAPPGD
jgi:diguanylate cyclase (GGDEF)-like protein/PAS domain S-box-containing protein